MDPVQQAKHFIRALLQACVIKNHGKSDAEAVQLRRENLADDVLGDQHRVGNHVMSGPGYLRRLGAEVLAAARAGDTEAAAVVAIMIVRLLRAKKKLPQDLAAYVADHFDGRLPKLRSGRPSAEDRNHAIGSAVGMVVSQFGVYPTRNEATRDLERGLSACSIVAEVLAEMGCPDDSEQKIERAWRLYLDSIEKNAGH